MNRVVIIGGGPAGYEAALVAAQLDVSVSAAFARLRAYAFAENRPLAAVATDIVDRKLRLADGKDTPDG